MRTSWAMSGVEFDLPLLTPKNVEIAVARPKVPLIARRSALQAALDIVDAEGLEALSIRRLGEALGVNGASLYHHFKNKDEILVGVAQLALADVTAPRDPSENWRVWMTHNTNRLREALVEHPALIPIMLRRAPLGIGLVEVESSVTRLVEEGVPIEMVVPLMESLELLAISSALQEVGPVGIKPGDVAEKAPELHVALQNRGMSAEELFNVMVASMISIIEGSIVTA